MEKPMMHSNEKAIRDMAACLKTQQVTLPLFGKDVPIIRASAVDEYLEKHIHDFYDYANMTQPEICIHDEHSICTYPISDCKNCPLINHQMPLTACRFE